MNISSLIKISFLGAVFLPLSSYAQNTITETFNPSQDTSIFSENDNSNGAGVHLYSGMTSASFRRALLQFDLSSIPSNATIASANLEITLNRSAPGSGSVNFSLHQLTADWGEAGSDAGTPGGLGTGALTGDATWNFNFFDSDSWSSAGGDFIANVSSTASVGSQLQAYNWSGNTMIADVQNWVSDSASNFGWILIGDENTQRSAKRFASREGTNPPVLTIEYTVAASQWAGYDINADGRSVFTDSFLGWIDISRPPYVYVYNLGKYVYLPEASVKNSGAWVFVGK